MYIHLLGWFGSSCYSLCKAIEVSRADVLVVSHKTNSTQVIMAYWMQVIGYDQAALGNIFESNMVAEPVVTQSLGDIMPVDFDPAEADRQVRLEIANAVGNVR